MMLSILPLLEEGVAYVINVPGANAIVVAIFTVVFVLLRIFVW